MKRTFTLLFLLIIFSEIQSQSNDNRDVIVIKCSQFGISKPLSEIINSNKNEYEEGEEEEEREKEESLDRLNRAPQVFKFSSKDDAKYGDDPSVRQTTMGNRTPTAPIVNWAGQNGNSFPPDPTGAAGLNHYVQAVNTTPFKIFNKVTGAQMGSINNIGSLWNPAVGNDGDPIVLYDKYADRWFLSQFGYGTPNKIYIAISSSPDPTGTYYTYTFTSTEFPDYEKFSIWQDGYYMTSNQNTQKVFCFERAQMLLGNAASRAISVNFNPGTISGFYIPLPADADGVLPPAGTPCPFFSYYDNGWNGTGVDAIKIWSMSVNWVPATPTAVVTSNPVIIPIAPFDGAFDIGWNDIPQPGVSQKLDGLGGLLMFRAQWRKWTGYNSVVLNFAVQVSASPIQRAIRWCELRQNDTTNQWSLYQEGTYAPNTTNRFIGSIAMNGEGSIGLCYAICDGTVSPSLAYTGRLATDPLNTMTFVETIAFAGSGAQTANNRFGDYSQTSIDPYDDITFWHTGEYLQGGGVRTRIYTFKLNLDNSISENSTTGAAVNAFQLDNEINIVATNLMSDDELMVDLFDIEGRKITGKKIIPTNKSFETTFNTANMAKGTYLVRVGKMNTSFQKVKKVFVK